MATDRSPRKKKIARGCIHPDGNYREVEYYSRYNLIISDDSTIGKSPYKDQVSKSCYHWKATTGLYPYPVWAYINSAGNSVYTTERPNEDDVLPPHTINQGQEMYLWWDISKPSRLGLQPDNFTPDIDTLLNTELSKMIESWSLLNFLFELDDIPKLLRSMIRLSGSAFRSIGEARYYGNPGNLSDAVLGYNLGYMPLKDDLEAILARFKNYSARCDKMALALKRGFRVVTGRTLDLSTTHEDAYTRVQVSDPSFKQIWGAVVCADSPLSGQMAQTLSQFGLFQNPLEVLWNATPFSFLVDYVVPIGDYYTQQLFLNPKIQRAWYTTRSQCNVDVFRKYGNHNTWRLAQTGTCYEYSRSKGPWDEFDGAQAALEPYGIHLMNPTQWQNILALSLSFMTS